VLAGGVEGLGERIVRRVLGVWGDPVNRTALLAIVSGASAHPGAAAALREFVRHEIVARIAGAIEADRPQLRANLVASQIIGLVAARYVVQVEPLAGLPADEVVPLVAPTLQRYVSGPM
jgi:Tetracyclin repressor-like, C-terminal domain